MSQKLLIKLVNSNPKETMDIVQDILLLKGYKNIIKTKNYLLAEGDTNCPVACVCHADTVFDDSFKEPREIYYDQEKKVVWCIPTGGFDDKLGINILLKIIISTEYRPSIIICNEEEKYCIGAQALVQDYPVCPFNVKYLLELDRANEKDCVFYHPPTEEFQKYVESFGWITTNGLYSDILVLESFWGISSVNVSVGYMRQHTSFEYFREDWAMASMKRIGLMLADSEKAPFYASNTKKEKCNLTDCCDICNKPIYSVIDFNLVNYEKDVDLTVCNDCIKILNIKPCKKCNNLFWDPKTNSDKCTYCIKK